MTTDFDRELATKTYRREDLPEDAVIATWDAKLGWVVDTRQPNALNGDVVAYCAFCPSRIITLPVASTAYVPATAPLDWTRPLLFVVFQLEYVPEMFLWVDS